MSTTPATPSINHPAAAASHSDPAPPTLRSRAGAVVSSAVAALLGILPHVLHHAGPLAGAALFAGAAGTLLFGAIGLVAAIPFLLRVHRRCGNWRTPAALLALFAIVFSISAFVIGPAISADDGSGSKATPNQTSPPAPTSGGHDAHH